MTIIAIMVFSAVYSSGTVHMFPLAFAADSQQRVYLLFHNGVFVGKDNWMIDILPNDAIKVDKHLSVSEDNLLTYERGTKVSVYDLNQSEPEKRK